MSLYSKALRHINMDRVKELREENIKKQKLAEEKLQEEIIRAKLKKIHAEETKHVNWRRELEEGIDGMTTAGMCMVDLPVEGDVDIVNTDTTYDDINSSLSQNVSRDGTTITLQGTENQIVNGVQTAFNVARFTVDATRVSHVKVTIQKGGGTTSWIDRIPAEDFTDAVTLNISDADDFNAPIYSNTNLSSGTHLIRLPGNYKNLRISFEQFAKVASEGLPDTTGALIISNVSLQRRIPVSLFVSLDDPEATAFIRDTLGNQNLSPTQKKKKLEQMLGASAEYLTKMFGEGIFTGASEISDVELQQSFADMAANQVDYGTDLTPLSDNPYGTEIAQVASVDLMNLGIDATTATVSAIVTALGISYNAAVNLKNSIMQMQGGYPDYGADAGPTTTGQPGTGVGDNTPEQQAEVEAAGNELRDAQRALNDLPADATDAQRDMARERLDRAQKNRQRIRRRNRNQRALPGYQGESVIHEKKKLKSPASLLDKIPGYYDGKPAPLGFPIEEPPKMKNGYHPDLVDGKKVANRYNRLDPTSAKAMPKTGNPHIDKKIRAAAKKPK